MPIDEELQRLIERFEPARILAVVGDDLPLPAAADRASVVRLRGPAQLGTSDHYDLALVDSAAGLPDGEVVHLLSRLRDLNARRVLVVVRPDATAAWTRHAMIGYGYTHHGRAVLGNVEVDLFQFDIDTYKHTPDWLNPDNWANPELWDRYRW